MRTLCGAAVAERGLTVLVLTAKWCHVGVVACNVTGKLSKLPSTEKVWHVCLVDQLLQSLVDKYTQLSLRT